MGSNGTNNVDAQAASYLPAFFAQQLEAQFGLETAQRILASCDGKRTVTLRANTLKTDRTSVAAQLEDAGIAYETVPWYADAFVCPHATERDIWDLEAYRAGALYLQSLSSMIPPLVLAACPGEDVLDMCAAPGGKTTQIVALSGNAAHVTACEMHAPRAEKLEHNLRKLGADNVTVMRCDARRLDDFFSFDRILVDAPCSGSGTLDATSPQTAKRFTPALIAKSQRSQQALLDKALALVKPGGTVVYSTCSVLAAENEEIVSAALKKAAKKGTYRIAAIDIAHGDDMPTLPSALEGTLLLAPTDRYEGFFVAKIVRVS